MLFAPCVVYLVMALFCFSWLFQSSALACLSKRCNSNIVNPEEVSSMSTGMHGLYDWQKAEKMTLPGQPAILI